MSTSTLSEPVTEYASPLTSGDMQVWNTDAETEEIYHVASRVAHQTRFGGKVYRRTVVVVENWTEVTAADVVS